MKKVLTFKFKAAVWSSFHHFSEFGQLGMFRCACLSRAFKQGLSSIFKWQNDPYPKQMLIVYFGLKFQRQFNIQVPTHLNLFAE